MALGDNLSKYAKERHLSQKELAGILEVNQKTLSSYIVGNSYPKYVELVRICNQLRVDPNSLMIGDAKYIWESAFKITAGEMRLLKKYRKISEHDKAIIDYIINHQEETEEGK